MPRKPKMISHEAWNWSSVDWNMLCRALAHVAQFNIDDMIGYGGTRAWEEFPDEPLGLMLRLGTRTIAGDQIRTLTARLTGLQQALLHWEKRFEPNLPKHRCIYTNRLSKFMEGLNQADRFGEYFRFNTYLPSSLTPR